MQAGIINKSEAVKKAKKEEEKLTPKEKKELTDEEKEYKSKRKEIQEKLIKFATRVPVFMYLTDYRERSLKDVITQLEPALFKKVTGLNVKDFELLCSLGVFNANLMNQAIFQFKRYEDDSLSYTGIDKHANDETIGGWDTVVKREEYQQLFYNQQATMETEQPPAPPVIPEQPKAAPPVQKPATPAPKPMPKPQPKPAQPTPKPTPAPQPKPAPTQPAPKPAEKTDAFVMPEVHVGTKVLHKKFGEGVIKSINEKRKMVSVQFELGEKNFEFPGGFERGFLTVIE